MSYLFYKHYLQSTAPSHGGGASSAKPAVVHATKDHRKRDTEDRERRIDAELAASMPASDSPSWTLGGSIVSKHQHH